MEKTLRKQVSLEDFNRFAWNDVIEAATEKECLNYAEGFREKIKQATSTGNSIEIAVFQILHDVSFFRFEPSDRDEPFKPLMSSGDGGRTVIPADFQDDVLNVLRQIAPAVADPEFRARLADLLWVRKRDYHLAGVAVEAYLGSARFLESRSSLFFSVLRIERALRLAAMLNKPEQVEKVKSLIGEFLDRRAEVEPLRCAHLMRLLIEFRIGEPAIEAGRARRIAEHAEGIRDLDAAREFWGFSSDWHRIGKDQAGERAARVAAAETYVRQAELFEAGSPPNHMLIADRLEKAIEAHRRVGEQQERINELHKRLLAVQSRSVDQMARFTSDLVDVSELVERAVSAVSGKSLHDALIQLALISRPRTLDSLRKEVEEQAKAFPISHTLHATIIAGTGKTVGRRPSMLSDDPDEREEGTRSWMFQQATIYRNLTAHACIEPARQRLLLEHPVELRDWHAIVADNPLIPPGREMTFAKGLQAGLIGDFLVAAHLLIPQLENSFRSILASQGVVTSKLDDEGIQREMYLQELLPLPEFKKIFGDDLTFELRGLLVERTSSNLRHSIAHSLLNDDQFFSAEVVYPWWLVLRLCLLPIRQRLATEESGSEDQ